MAMNMPFQKGGMMQGGKPSMSELMGVEKKEHAMPAPKGKGKGAAKGMPFKKKPC